jgi:hypothetical protein
MIGTITLDYGTGHFDGECAYWSATIVDERECSVTYTREYTSETALRAAVWFNIGPVEWVYASEFENVYAATFADQQRDPVAIVA